MENGLYCLTVVSYVVVVVTFVAGGVEIVGGGGDSVGQLADWKNDERCTKWGRGWNAQGERAV